MEAFLDEKQAEAILKEKRLDATLMDYLVWMVANGATETCAKHTLGGCMLEITFELSKVSEARRAVEEKTPLPEPVEPK